MVETRLLQYFLTVARERSITKAAMTLHITQPTLSRQMTQLEEKLGAKLFAHGSRPLMLTEEGILLFRRAEEILDLLEKTQKEVQTHEEQIEGTISIGCGEMESGRLLVKLMAEFARQYPKVTFDIHTGNADKIKLQMDNGLTDIGLLLEPVEIERYEYIRLPVKEQWVAVIPAKASIAGHAYVTAQELANIPVIMPSRQTMHDEVANWFGSSYENLRIVSTSNLSTNAALMVQAGMGTALTIKGALPFLEENDICMRPLYPALYSTSVLAWKRAQPFQAATSRFLEYIKCFLGMKQA